MYNVLNIVCQEYFIITATHSNYHDKAESESRPGIWTKVVLGGVGGSWWDEASNLRVRIKVCVLILSTDLTLLMQ